MMPGQICARCGAPRRVPATHFIEYPNPDTDAPAYLHLCKACARRAAEIIREYGEGAHLVDLGGDAPVQPYIPEQMDAILQPYIPEETKPAPDALKLIHRALVLMYSREYGAFGKDGSIEKTLDELEARL